MVILVVCLWHEPDSQLLAWAWHWGHRDRWQPNAFYCLPLPLVRITSVMNTARMTWISLSLYCMRECVHVCVDGANVCVSVCVCALQCHIAALCADTATRAAGRTWCVRAVHQLLMHECQIHATTHRHARPGTQLYICSFHSWHMRACIHTILHWHMLRHVNPWATVHKCVFVHSHATKNDTRCSELQPSST